MTRTLDVVVGLGSNLGDRALSLRTAARELGRVFRVRACSPIYETAPVGPPQPDYLNAAIRLETTSPPEQILETLLAIERLAGRVRSTETRWGPRTLDLDILWIDGVALATPALVVPHPRLTERAFALLPLKDVAPDAVDPRTGALFPVLAPDPGVRATGVVLQPEPA